MFMQKKVILSFFLSFFSLFFFLFIFFFLLFDAYSYKRVSRFFTKWFSDYRIIKVHNFATLYRCSTLLNRGIQKWKYGRESYLFRTSVSSPSVAPAREFCSFCGRKLTPVISWFNFIILWQWNVVWKTMKRSRSARYVTWDWIVEHFDELHTKARFS
jgi:hypothetical protein